MGDIDVNHYDASATAGSINLSSRALLRRQFHTELNGQFQNKETLDATLNHFGGLGNFSYFASAGYSKGNELNLPGSVKMPSLFTDDQTVLHNTGHEKLNLFFRSEYHFSDETKLSLTALHSQGEFGSVASFERSTIDSVESRLDYPEMAFQMASLNLASELAPSLSLNASLWTTRMRLEADHISLQVAQGNSYVNTSRYGGAESKYGGQVALTTNWSNHKLSAIGKFTFSPTSLLISERGRLIQTAFNNHFFDSGIFPRHVRDENLDIFNMSIGLNYILQIDQNKLAINVSGLYNSVPLPTYTQLENDKIRLAFNLNYAHQLSELFNLSFSVARSVHSASYGDIIWTSPANAPPTLYDQIKNETINKVASDLSYYTKNLLVEITAFGELLQDPAHIYGTIIQEDSTATGTHNLRDIGTLGLTLRSNWHFNKDLKISGNFTYMYMRQLDKFDRFTLKVSNRPSIIGRFDINYQPPTGFAMLLETILQAGTVQKSLVWLPNVYAKRGYEYEDILSKPQVNARLAWRFTAKPADKSIEVFLRANNFLDAEIYQNLRYPLPGRALSAGVKVSF